MKTRSLLLATLVLFTASELRANFDFDGAELDATSTFAASTSFSPATFTVGPGNDTQATFVDFLNNTVYEFDVDFFDNKVSVNQNIPTPSNQPTQQYIDTWFFTDAQDTLPDFETISLFSISLGLPASQIEPSIVDANTFSIRFNEIGFRANEQFTLQLTTVPEPSSLLVLAAGVGCLGGLRRRSDR